MNLCVPPHWCIPRRSVGLSPVILSSSSKVVRQEVAGPGVGRWRSLGGGERDNPLVMVVVPSLALMSSLFHSYEWVRVLQMLPLFREVILRSTQQGLTWFKMYPMKT